MFISSSLPSHGFALGGFIHFLFVWPSMFVSRDVSGSVNYVFSSRLTLPAAGGVKTLLVWPCKLGGVRETAHCRGSHGSLWGSFENVWVYSVIAGMNWVIFTLWVLPWLLQWPEPSPQSAWRPRPQPPLQSCLCISSWPALQVQPWTRQMWCSDRISS